MAIRIQRGLNQTVDVTYTLAGQTAAVDLGTGFTGEMIIRERDGSDLQGKLIDTLSTANARVVLVSSPAAAGPNIQLKWDTEDSEALPNKTQAAVGDLRITATATGEIAHHIRFGFDISEEVVVELPSDTL